MTERVLILGIDGYIGYPLAIHLLKRGYKVYGLDSLIRRQRVKNCGSDSLIPISDPRERERHLQSLGLADTTARTQLHDYYITSKIISEYRPDTIIHLAEQPSAPYSMKGIYAAAETQYENILGTLGLLWAMREHCPDAHLIKLGTMGEYGTPNCEIPEGMIPEGCIGDFGQGEWKHDCPMSGLMFPRSPNSFYHLSKVHDTYNIKFACDTWGLTSTDIMQGIVFGSGIEPNTLEIELTRFDYDECFGTVINRFCAQAIVGTPLTVYGKGYQRRGFLPLRDSIQCLTLALENKPVKGTYRTFNQFEDIYSIQFLAETVVLQAKSLGIEAKIQYINNPRTELEKHHYTVVHDKLATLGYNPTSNINYDIHNLLATILPYAERVIREVALPKIYWK